MTARLTNRGKEKDRHKPSVESSHVPRAGPDRQSASFQKVTGPLAFIAGAWGFHEGLLELGA
jgi:hypothetical protein